MRRPLLRIGGRHLGDREPYAALPHERAILGGLLLIGLLALMPDIAPARTGDPGVRLEHGRIASISQTDPATGQRSAVVVLLDGDGAGQSVTADLDPGGPATQSMTLQVNDEVVVQISTTPDGDQIAISDRWRLPLLGGILGLFALLVVLVGGVRGIRALLALALTVGVVAKVVLPLLVIGWPPVPVAVGTASLIAVVTLLMTEGVRRSTFAAAAGTFGALALTAVLAAVATSIAEFSPAQGSEEAAYLQGVLGAPVDLSGLLLAAVIFGALGVLDDVTVTQAATVAELAEADLSATRAMLVRRAMNVGRSHIAATINTLVLAYVAASLPLMLLFAVGGQSPATIASTERVAVEVVRTIVGSIGIVAAVPLTTLIGAFLEDRP